MASNGSGKPLNLTKAQAIKAGRRDTPPNSSNVGLYAETSWPTTTTGGYGIREAAGVTQWKDLKRNETNRKTKTKAS